MLQNGYKPTCDIALARMREGGVATIGDVARKAGVARTTVSHALSGKRPVAADTRERVLAAARELGYQPNAAARSLTSRRMHTVGLALPLDFYRDTLPEGPFFGFIAHAADRLAHHDYRLLCLISREPDPAELVRLARAGYVDGLLLLQVRLVDPRIAPLRAVGLPFVVIGRPRDTAGLICVDADLAAAADMAVQYLADLGHRRIALLTAFVDGAPVYGFQYHALAGFERAHRRYGLPPRPDYVLAYDPAHGPHAALRSLLAGSAADGPTALITTTDLEAVMALHTLAECGRRVPDDVSLVTLGDSVLTELAQPPVTAVRFSVADETRAAADLLMGLLAGEQPPAHARIIPVELLPRHSTRNVSSQ